MSPKVFDRLDQFDKSTLSLIMYARFVRNLSVDLFASVLQERCDGRIDPDKLEHEVYNLNELSPQTPARIAKLRFLERFSMADEEDRKEARKYDRILGLPPLWDGTSDPMTMDRSTPGHPATKSHACCMLQ
ncbi:MAG: hypothetical protein Q9166_005293 [cf. Caloplaca sp. 2 TL-2023]